MPGYSNSPYAGAPYGSIGGALNDGTRALPKAAKAPLIENGDYVRDENGDLTDSDPVLEQVKFLLCTVEGFVTPDQFTRDNTVFKIKAFTDDSPIEIRDRVLLALKPAMSEGSNAIKNVVVVPNPQSLGNSTALLEYSVSFEKTGLI